MNITPIGERIRSIRLQQKMTQAKLAKGICSVAYLSKVENGLVQPSDELITLFTTRLAIPLDHVSKIGMGQLDEMIDHYCATREVKPEWIMVIAEKVRVLTCLQRVPIMYAMLLEHYYDMHEITRMEQCVENASEAIGLKVKAGYERSFFVYLNLICLFFSSRYQFQKLAPIIADLLLIPLSNTPSVFHLQFYNHINHMSNVVFGDYYQARFYSLKIIELEKHMRRDLSDSYVELIVLDLKYNHVSHAQKLLSEAEQNNYFRPDDYFVDYCYARFYEATEQIPLAISYFEKAFANSEKRRGHKRIILISRMLRLLILEGRIEESQYWLEYGLSVMQQSPINTGHSSLYYYKAKLFLLSGDTLHYEQGMLFAIRFAFKNELWSDFQLATHELATYYYERRQYKQAAKLARWHIERKELL